MAAWGAKKLQEHCGRLQDAGFTHTPDLTADPIAIDTVVDFAQARPPSNDITIQALTAAGAQLWHSIDAGTMPFHALLDELLDVAGGTITP